MSQFVSSLSLRTLSYAARISGEFAPDMVGVLEGVLGKEVWKVEMGRNGRVEVWKFLKERKRGEVRRGYCDCDSNWTVLPSQGVHVG